MWGLARGRGGASDGGGDGSAVEAVSRRARRVAFRGRARRTVPVRTARAGMKVAEDAGDQPSADLFTQRMEIHEKNAWMLRSLLEPAS